MAEVSGSEGSEGSPSDGGEGRDERRGRVMSSRAICTSFREDELSGALFRRIPSERVLFSSFSTQI